MDAFGAGGVEFLLEVAKKKYYFRVVKRIRDAIKISKVGDGNGVKGLLEKRAFQALEKYLNEKEGKTLRGMKALQTNAVDRYQMAEAMVDAGVHLGFPRRIAEQLVAKTVRGSVDYYRKRDVHLARLRNEVTSPGGTSAAALYYLEKAGFRTAISRAIWAAFERSRELGKDAKSHSPEPADTN